MKRQLRRCEERCTPYRRNGMLPALCAAAALCLPALAACTSAGTTTAYREAGGLASSSISGTPAPYAKPLLGCTSAQRSAARAGLHVVHVISSQTVHVTVGERIDIRQTLSPMRPGATGVGKLWLRAGQQVICQRGPVAGRFRHANQGPGQRLPLIITQPGHAEIDILAGFMIGNSPVIDIIYIDATQPAG